MRSYLIRRFFHLNLGSSRAAHLLSDRTCFILLLAITLGMYLALPKQGDIDWPDAPRHALNGAFVLDFVKAFPWRHPIDFAYDYYRQWPALTILFYPPAFYVPLAATYAAFGVSEASALLTELAFLLLLAWGAFRLSRHWLDPAPALATALLLIGVPELAYWGRQIMLDVPAYALVVWAGEFMIHYLKSERRGVLCAAVVCTVAAVYTKYNAIFFAAPIAVAIIYTHGRHVFQNNAVLQAAALGCVLLLPIVAVFFVFSSYNLQQAAAVPGAETPRRSIAGLVFYAHAMPSVISWPTLALACLYVLALPFVSSLRLPRADGVFLCSWVLIGYAFYSMIALKETRHILFITYPFALAAVLFLDRTLARFKFRYAIPLIFAGAILTETLVTGTVPAVSGVRQTAETTAQLAPT